MPHDQILGLKHRDHYAVCVTCKKKHLIARDDEIHPALWNDWLLKHPAPLHQTLIVADEPKLLDGLDHNADVKTAYGSSGAYTITLTSLASDTSLVAGRESTAVDNATTVKYLDYLIGGKVTTGTSPTASRLIELWAYGSVDDTPTYPDGITGSDAARTLTSADIKNAALGFLGSVITDSNSNRTYWFRPTSLARAFRGEWVPKNHGLFVTHSTAVALNATASNHALSRTPIYSTVA